MLCIVLIYVIGPAKTGHICTNHTCSVIGTFLDLCLRYTSSINVTCFSIDLLTWYQNYIEIALKLGKEQKFKFQNKANLMCRYALFYSPDNTQINISFY